MIGGFVMQYFFPLIAYCGHGGGPPPPGGHSICPGPPTVTVMDLEAESTGPVQVRV
jgi:hypothetical protein